MTSSGHETHNAYAVGATAALVAFIGAIVVLSIPYAVISAPLPATVDRVGVSNVAAPALAGRPAYLLVPATLIALWIGYRSYRLAHAEDTSEAGQER